MKKNNEARFFKKYLMWLISTSQILGDVMNQSFSFFSKTALTIFPKLHMKLRLYKGFILAKKFFRKKQPLDPFLGKKGSKRGQKNIFRKKFFFYSKSLNSQKKAIKKFSSTILDLFDPFLTLTKFFKMFKNNFFFFYSESPGMT